MNRILARRLRRLADRIDHAGAPKITGWSFTFEEGEGIRFRADGHGCRLWYLGDADYERAHADAGATRKLPRYGFNCFCGDWVTECRKVVSGACLREARP